VPPSKPQIENKNKDDHIEIDIFEDVDEIAGIDYP